MANIDKKTTKQHLTWPALTRRRREDLFWFTIRYRHKIKKWARLQEVQKHEYIKARKQ